MLTLAVLSPLMLVLLCSPQQFLDVLGDLLSFADDVFCGGQTGVRLTFMIIQLGYRAALSHPATAAQTTSTAEAAKVEDRPFLFRSWFCLPIGFESFQVIKSKVHTYPESSRSDSLTVLS